MKSHHIHMHNVIEIHGEEGKKMFTDKNNVRILCVRFFFSVGI